MRSFSAAAKAEICRSFPQADCCALAGCFGILLFCNCFRNDSVKIITESREFAALLPKLFKKAFGFGFDVQAGEGKGGKQVFQIQDAKKLDAIMDAFGFDTRQTLSLHVNLPVVEEDCCKRAASAAAEIAFIKARKAQTEILTDLLKAGELPLRLTHNDTKLNNVLLDPQTYEAVCIVDFDTIMPGLTAYDFGDAIRFGANTAVEDEPDTSRVSLSLPLYKAYVKGFMEGCGERLTPKEIETLPLGAKTITLEQGIRFLTDYLQGDTYYQTSREGQNMERKWDEMQI